MLANAETSPEMAVWSDNVRIFDTAMAYGILTEPAGEQLKHCYTAMRNRIHHLNLLRQPSCVPMSEFETERDFIGKMWSQIFQ